METPMTGLLGRILRREFAPWRAGAQNPKHAMEHRPPAGAGHGRPRPSALRLGRNIASRIAHWASLIENYII